VAIAVEAGLLLCAAYQASGTLWLPIGIHFGWNAAEGAIFGFGHASGGLLSIRFAGPSYLTGGASGPEAGLPAVLLCLGAAYYYVRRTGSIPSGRGTIARSFTGWKARLQRVQQREPDRP